MRPSILLLTATLLHAQQLTLTPAVPDDQIQSLLARGSEPSVAAILDPSGRRVITHNATATTPFDAAAIAPALTTFLLQNMARAGEVALADPVSKYLPSGTAIPARGKKQITLLDLATNTSGLPSTGPLPIELARKPGAKYEYSALGMSLLAEALAARANAGYEALLRARILDPLGMADTRFDAGRRLRSTANDLLKLLESYTDPESPLNKDTAALMKTRRPVNDQIETSLGWQVRKTNYCARKGVCFMNQMYDLFTSEDAPDSTSFIGFDPKTRAGVVVLSNDVKAASSLGLYLLSPYAYPLKQ